MSLDDDDDEAASGVIVDEATTRIGLLGELPLLILITGVPERDEDADVTAEEFGAGEFVLPATPSVNNLCLRS